MEIKKIIAKLKSDAGYCGKPEQWQRGFDLATRELGELAAELSDDLKKVYDVFGLHHGVSLGILLTNCQNAARRSLCLSHVEHIASVKVICDDPECYGEEVEESLLNWGHSPEQYAERFQKIWDERKQAVPDDCVLLKKSERDREVLELIDERDHFENQAEQLKDKLQKLYGVDFGEHSSCNFPFQNAIDFDDSDYVLVPKEPTEKINNAGLHEYRKLVGLGPDGIGYIYKAMIEAAQENTDGAQ